MIKKETFVKYSKIAHTLKIHLWPQKKNTKRGLYIYFKNSYLPAKHVNLINQPAANKFCLLESVSLHLSLFNGIRVMFGIWVLNIFLK